MVYLRKAAHAIFTLPATSLHINQHTNALGNHCRIALAVAPAPSVIYRGGFGFKTCLTTRCAKPSAESDDEPCMRLRRETIESNHGL